jgi:mono/diheme cytochrome c family protein
MIRRIDIRILVLALAALTLFMFVAGCGRGRPSRRTPIHINPNMDEQEKYKPQAESKFFADGATMRMPVPGTVALDELHDSIVYYTGKDARGEYVEDNPLEINLQLLQRGRERFDIYCSPCHSRVGDGRGIMVSRGYVPPPSFHQDNIIQMKNGYYFDVISHGVRNMPTYGNQVRVADRWAIVAYLRALQRSWNATVDDVPEELRNKIKQAGQ